VCAQAYTVAVTKRTAYVAAEGLTKSVVVPTEGDTLSYDTLVED